MDIKMSNKKDNENNREYAYRILRNNIMKLSLLPGTTLNESELAEMFHMSRTPIHEAVIMLKEEALVKVYPQSASKVSYIDINIMKEGYFIRSVIEPKIISQIAGNMLKEHTELLRLNLEEQKAAILETENIDSFFKLDDKFHKIIYQAGEKLDIWYAVKRICSHYDRVRYLDAIINHTDLNDICREHQQLYHILLIGYTDNFNLQNFYEEHLGIYKKNFRHIVEDYSQYFGI